MADKRKRRKKGRSKDKGLNKEDMEKAMNDMLPPHAADYMKQKHL